jgi:hypothetical protein
MLCPREGSGYPFSPFLIEGTRPGWRIIRVSLQEWANVGFMPCVPGLRPREPSPLEGFYSPGVQGVRVAVPFAVAFGAFVVEVHDQAVAGPKQLEIAIFSPLIQSLQRPEVIDNLTGSCRPEGPQELIQGRKLLSLSTSLPRPRCDFFSPPGHLMVATVRPKGARGYRGAPGESPLRTIQRARQRPRDGWQMPAGHLRSKRFC